MPSDDRVRLHDDQGAAPVPPGFGEQDPKEPIARAKLRSFCCARQGGQLLTEREVLERDRPVSAAHQSDRSEEHTSELQSPCNLVCRLLLEKKKKKERQLLSR